MSLIFIYPRQIIALLLLLVNLSVFAGEFHPQRNDTTISKIGIADTALVVNQEIIILWTKKNALGVTFNEVAFVNWNAGGNNSVSALFSGNFQRNYQKKLLSWKTNASLRFGLNAQKGRNLRKSEDQLLFNSTFGYRQDSTSSFRYSAKLNFNTQFANGYKYPNTEKPISKLWLRRTLFWE
jgi:hypothetical protein